jgi:hypothetical protein
MNMMLFPGLAHKIKFLVNDNSTTLLTGVGVAGTAATAYLTGRASFKAADIIERERAIVNTAVEENVDPVALTKSDKVKLVWKLYVPPVATGITTIIAIVSANRISSKKIAALAVASGISERALQEYKDKVYEKLGERQSKNLHEEIHQDRVTNSKADPRQIVIVGSNDVLCYDGLTGRYFQSSVEKIKQAENEINFEILRHMYSSLSEFYERIGLPPTTYSDSVGWHGDGAVNVMLSTVMSPDNRPCISIDFEKMPVVEYYKIYD